jgi:hypothetical protein
MTDINSELERLRAAPQLERAGIFESICASFSSNAIARALCATPAKVKAKSSKKAFRGVDRGGRPLSDR